MDYLCETCQLESGDGQLWWLHCVIQNLTVSYSKSGKWLSPVCSILIFLAAHLVILNLKLKLNENYQHNSKLLLHIGCASMFITLLYYNIWKYSPMARKKKSNKSRFGQHKYMLQALLAAGQYQKKIQAEIWAWNFIVWPVTEKVTGPYGR